MNRLQKPMFDHAFLLSQLDKSINSKLDISVVTFGHDCNTHAFPQIVTHVRRRRELSIKYKPASTVAPH